MFMKVLKNRRNRESGMTLIEVLASLTILLIGLLSLVTLFPQGMKSAQTAKELTIASLLAQQKLEDIKREESLWPVGTIAGPAPFVLEEGYKWQVSVINAGGTDRLVTVTVSWRDRDYSVQTKL
jgi:prepilin-type N-terminal cleavage/methylation domain-containing protein